MPSLLGGEISMWSDTYCYTQQCGAYPGPAPVGAALFPPAMDTFFGQSVGGMMFPRGFVGAASFWNYNDSVEVRRLGSSCGASEESVVLLRF